MREANGAVSLRFDAGVGAGPVSALLRQPEGAEVVYVLAHGAGAGMRHPFLEGLAEALAAVNVATFRFQFPYMEEGRRRPDPPHVARATVRSAVAAAARAASELPLLAGGKSFGGRMTSSAAAEEPLAGVHGLVFVGFPLHPPKRPAIARAQHLDAVTLPMLFLQGTRDDLASLDLITAVCRRLGSRATLHVLQDADHSFHLPKRLGRAAGDVLAELAATIRQWSRGALQARPSPFPTP